MKLRVSRHSIEIIPEGPTDEAYIEEVLGLRKAGEWACLTRINASGLSCIAYLQASNVAAPAAQAGGDR